MTSTNIKSSDDDDDGYSPPTYRVEEDEQGELINSDLQVKYPERPKTGRYSWGNYLQKKQANDNKNRKILGIGNLQIEMEPSSVDFESSSSTSIEKNCLCTCGNCCNHKSRIKRPYRQYLKKKNTEKLSPKKEASYSPKQYEDMLADKMMQCNMSDCSLSPDQISGLSSTSFSTFSPSPNWSGWTDSPAREFKSMSMPVSESYKKIFIGPKTSKHVEKMLQPTQFLIYYRRPNILKSLDDLPLSEPLTLAYKSSSHKVFHYRIKMSKSKNGDKLWKVDVDQNVPVQPSFYTLDQLIKYYKVFALCNGNHDVF